MKRKFRTRILTVVLAVTMVFTSMPVTSYGAINYHEWLDTAKKVAIELGNAKFKFDRMGCPKGSFSKAKKLSNARRKCNCSDYISWSLVRLGLLKNGKRFYAKGKAVHGSGASTIKGKNFDIIKISGAPRASTLVKKGILKPGDIISQADGSGHHMQIYAGKNSKGTNLWWAIGKKYQVVNGYLNAKRMMNTHKDHRAHHHNPRVAMIIRIHGIQWVDYFKITTKVTNGTISKDCKVYWNKSKTIKYTAKAHYHLSAIYIDGKKIKLTGHAKQYTFKNVKKAHKISVVFAKDQFEVAATALDQDGNEAGVITGAGMYKYGNPATVEVTPNEGYAVDKILVDGEEVEMTEPGQTSYTIDSVTAAVNIEFIMVKVDEGVTPPADGQEDGEQTTGTETGTLPEGTDPTDPTDPTEPADSAEGTEPGDSPEEGGQSQEPGEPAVDPAA